MVVILLELDPEGSIFDSFSINRHDTEVQSLSIGSIESIETKESPRTFNSLPINIDRPFTDRCELQRFLR